MLDLDEATVQQLVDQLIKKRLASEQSGYGNRVPKFQHLFCNTNFGTLKFSPQELAIVCELFLRGAQTPGELRSRASRMCRFADVTEIEAVLNGLAAREPGRRESRYAHLFSGEPADAEQGETRSSSAERPEHAGDADERWAQLERRVTELETVVAELRQALKPPAGS